MPPPPPSQTTNSESYFVEKLAEYARQPEVATPVSPDEFIAKLQDYLSPAQVAVVRKAYRYADVAHEGVARKTGHPYITHPLAVANILADMRMDHETLAAALLHDVLEDTQIAKDTLGAEFGMEVAELVDGVSKLTKMFHSRAEAQAENFQKMAMAMAKDIRVIIVKLADRLHNMRTIGVMSREKRKRIARETLDYYAPIANRLGMHAIKQEFESLGFKALYPLRADRIERAVIAAKGNRRALVDEIRKTIKAALKREKIRGKVEAREKHPYSIYQKMRSQKKPFEQIMDVFGFRIVVNKVDDCYRALGIVHNLYKPVIGRFKDYIAIPKVNGYQSLHTSLFGMRGVPIEVQIRTEHMEQVAESGIAGHWRYKSDTDQFQPSQHRARQWVSNVLDLQAQAGNPMEFIESLKIDLFPDEVYVFTPQGDILELPRGACPVDFAYAVHTQIGNRCIASKVDRQLAPLSQQLQSGQSVEIITSDAATPSPDWLTFVVSGKARSGIRQALKAQQLSDSIAFGRRLLNRSLSAENTSLNDLDFRRLRSVFKEFNVRKLDELLGRIGNGELMSYVVAQKLLAANNPEYKGLIVEDDGPVAIRGGEGLVINYARCCGPVPGDQIVGRMTPGKGFVVHMETCTNMAEIRRRNPQEIIPANWAEVVEGEYMTTLRVDAEGKKGLIAEIASAIAATDAGLDNVSVEERDAVLSSISIRLSVRDLAHLERVLRRLRALTQVKNISRISG